MRLRNAANEIVAANERDCLKVSAEVRAGRISQAFFDRLQTNQEGVADMATKVRAAAKLPDPLGQTLSVTSLASDLNTAQKLLVLPG